MVLLSLCLSYSVALQAETKMKVVFQFENAEYNGFDLEKEIQDKYQTKWEEKKKAFVNEFVKQLDSHLKGHGYTIVQEGEADYTLRVDVRDLDLDSELSARVYLSSDKRISRRRFDIENSKRGADSYLELPSTTFNELADAIYKKQLWGQINHNVLPSTQPRKTVTDIMLEVKGFGDIYKSTYLSDGQGAQVACNFNIKGLVYVGGGLGISHHQYYYYELDSKVEVPVFVQAKYFFLERRVTPYVSTQLGYTFGKIEFDGWYTPSWAHDHEKFNLGLYYQANLGVHVQLKHGAIQADWGVKHQTWDCGLKERDFVNFSVGYSYTIKNTK